MHNNNNYDDSMGNLNYLQGTIKGISDGGVHISFFGRLGELHIPKRMIISEKPAKVGDIVGIMLTYPEVIEEYEEKENI